jgi:DNA helicase-2/ATP-dependent DNA helicase PcrA
VLDLSRLNPEQRRAVTTTEGPLLVVAGPGSGKTAVIAARTAYLIESHGVDPSAMLAVTFTNQAGRELRRRVADVLGERATGVWAGTFHAFALGLLRRRGGELGFDPRHLSVYADGDDRRAALRQAVHDLGRSLAGERPDTILRALGRAKERLLWPADVAAYDPDLGAVYAAYQAVLARRNALDFDDFLLYAVRLLEERPGLLAELQETYRYVLVDVFQDVGPAQHRLLALLAGRHRNLCVVGDPLQNLFAWRGSDIRYLLDFGRAYPDAQVPTLTQSYRATGTLLAAANALGALVRYGPRRLWTANPPGTPVIVETTGDARGEAAFVAVEVQRLLA